MYYTSILVVKELLELHLEQVMVDLMEEELLIKTLLAVVEHLILE